MHVIICFCSYTSVQSSTKSKCLPSNWKNRSSHVGDAGQCWVLPQASVMRGLYSVCAGACACASARVTTKFYVQVWFRSGNNDKWTSPSWLNVEAITLLSKSRYFPCFILLDWLDTMLISVSLRMHYKSEAGCEGLIPSSCLCSYTLIKGLIPTHMPFVLQKQKGENEGRQGPFTAHCCHQDQCPSKGWIIGFHPTNRILQLLHLELLSWQKHILECRK